MRFSLRAKRIFTGAAAGALVLSMLPAGVASADTEAVCANAGDSGFSDKGTTHGDNIDCMAAYDVMQGRLDGSFGTFDNITRGATAAVLVNFALAAWEDIEVPTDDDPFTDKGNVYDDEINALWNLGLTDGVTATTYEPAEFITRGQFAALLFEAHVALGTEFDDSYPEAFPDAGDTFGDEINALAGEGIIDGYTDGTFGTWDNITRGAVISLLAESAGVLDDAGNWDADRLVDPSADVYTSLNVSGDVDPNFGDDPTDEQNSILVSDGAAVSIVVFDPNNDSFFVDGSASTVMNFVANISVADEITVSGNADGEQDFELENVAADATTSGVVGGVELDDDTLDIVDGPSGEVLNDDVSFDGAIFSVDGTTVNQATFENNLSVGDTVSYTVDEDDNPESFVLANAIVTGDVVDVDDVNAAAITIDVVTDDDGDFGTGALEIPGHVITDVDTTDDVDFTLNGNAVAVDTDFETDVIGDPDVVVGGELVYARAGSEVTVTYTSQAAEALETTVVGFTGSGEVVNVHLGNDATYDSTESATFIDVALATDVDVIRIDGSLATAADLFDEINVGDQVVYQAANAAADVDGELWLTNANLEGEITAVDGSNIATVDVVNATIELDLATEPQGYDGDDERYFIDGSEVALLSDFATDVTTALDDDDTVMLEVTGTSIATSFNASIS